MAISLIFCIVAFLASAECANILFFIAFGGPSHRIAMEPLANALTANGHQITFLVQEQPSPPTNPKINYFVSEKVEGFFDSLKHTENEIDLYEMRRQGNTMQSRFIVSWYGVKVCEALYNDPSFLKFIRETTFDLVFMDALFSECGYGVAHLHQAKTIMFVVSSVPPWIVDGIGIPDESSSIPTMTMQFSQKMTFAQRLVTAVTPVLWRMYREWYHFPQLERITTEGLKSFKTNTPSFTELERKLDLVLVNTHVAQEYPRSFPSNVIAVGGISWNEDRKPLPKDLEDFIDRGKNGFVYVNFGSYLDFSMLPVAVQQKFLNVLGNFSNVQFIWKMRTKPENLPDNIFAKQWMPQQNLLLHPKIQVFITHSGIGGVNEAIYGSVPLLCFPVFADQDYNAFLVESKGIGLKMEITAFKEEDLRNALKELLANNEKYRENVIRVRRQFIDRPMKPVETALWWTEYVLRQDTMDFRRPVSVNQPWWMKRQIDVWLLISLLVFSILTFFIFLMWSIFKYLCLTFVNKTMSYLKCSVKVKGKGGNRNIRSKSSKHKRQ